MGFCFDRSSQYSRERIRLRAIHTQPQNSFAQRGTQDGLTSNQQRSTIDYRFLMAVYWLETQSGLLIAGFLRALVSLDRGGALELIGRSNLRWSGHCMQSSCDLLRYIATEP